MSNNFLSKEEEALLASIDEEKKRITTMYKELLGDYMSEERMKNEKVLPDCDR